MVKKKTARQKVREKGSKKDSSEKRDGDTMVTDAASEWGSDDGRDPKTERASVKRKMAKQMRFLDKLQETQRVLSAKKTISKKRRKSQTGRALNNLSSLSEFLPTLTSSTTIAPATKILRSKAKQKIVTHETKQLAAVLAHPQFKANPFAAIQQHLTTTIPASTPVPPAAVKKVPASQKKKKKPSIGEQPSQQENGPTTQKSFPCCVKPYPHIQSMEYLQADDLTSVGNRIYSSCITGDPTKTTMKQSLLTRFMPLQHRQERLQAGEQVLHIHTRSRPLPSEVLRLPTFLTATLCRDTFLATLRLLHQLVVQQLQVHDGRLHPVSEELARLQLLLVLSTGVREIPVAEVLKVGPTQTSKSSTMQSGQRHGESLESNDREGERER